jgi:hypothetical protein
VEVTEDNKLCNLIYNIYGGQSSQAPMLQDFFHKYKKRTELTPGAVFATIYIVRILQMGPTSLIDTLK